MSDELKEIRILMLGESNVGKTSLILSLISEQYIDEQQNNLTTFELPAKIESILIPPGVTIENVPVLITDYSIREQTLDDLTSQIHRTNAICLVYAVNDDGSKEKLASFWLPKINEVLDGLKKPVLIIGLNITEKYSQIFYRF
jgi:GTPase SAR1 family protein